MSALCSVHESDEDQACTLLIRSMVTHVCDFTWFDGTHLVGHQGHNRHGFTIERSKFNLVNLAALMNKNDRTDIASRQSMRTQIAMSKNYVVEFFNHVILRKG